MSDDSIAKKVLKGLGGIGEETGKEALHHVAEMTTGIITGKELLGQVTEMSDEQLQQKKLEDERKSKEEMAKLQAQMNGQGRHVEQEMEQVHQEKEQIEEQKEKEEEQQKMAEEQQMMVAAPAPEPAGRPSRGKMGGGRKKKQEPTADQMTATSEFKGKVD